MKTKSCGKFCVLFALQVILHFFFQNIATCNEIYRLSGFDSIEIKKHITATEDRGTSQDTVTESILPKENCYKVERKNRVHCYNAKYAFQLKKVTDDSKWILDRLELNPDILTDNKHTGVSGYDLDSVAELRVRRQPHMNIPIAKGVSADLETLDSNPSFHNLKRSGNQLSFLYRQQNIAPPFDVTINMENRLPSTIITRYTDELKGPVIFRTVCNWTMEGELIKSATFDTTIVDSPDDTLPKTNGNFQVWSFDYNTKSREDFTLSSYGIAEPKEYSSNGIYVLYLVLGIAFVAIALWKMPSFSK